MRRDLYIHLVDAMRYEWDEAKRLQNLRDHGIDFVDVKRVFAGPTFTFEDNLHGVPVSIAHAETGDVIRPISFRRATKYETAILFEKIADQLPKTSGYEGRGRPAYAGTSRGKRKAHHPRGGPKGSKGRPA